MADYMAAPKTEAPNDRGYWQEQIEKASKRYQNFHTDGDKVQERYRNEKASEAYNGQDRYNILYSSTETIKPSLYGQTPKVQATKRFPDNNNPKTTMATLLAETVTQYLMEETDFDDVIESVVEDFLLPGLGTAWVRYDASVSSNEEGAATSVEYEGVAVDYVYWRDFLSGPARTWQLKPWVARRVYFTKELAKARFSEEILAKMKFTHNKPEDESLSTDDSNLDSQAIIWEIWDKRKKQVIWYSPDCTELLDRKNDPLKVKNFFPCPRPLRAVKTNSKFVPKSFFTQYKAQAEELDRLTQRIRYLTEALKVRGVFDGSNPKLEELLNGPGNKMVAVENWAQFAGSGGINGAIQWVPIKDVAAVLNELYKQREIVKAEIYEITGFSDIVRGVSKASETLGAQEIKNNWATGRLRGMQREVQRFCRDIIRLMTEIAFEQFSDKTLMLYSGFQLSQDDIAQHNAQAAQAAMAGLALPVQETLEQRQYKMFSEVASIMRDEKQRCALIGIETDSTILPDEQKERTDRMAFLSAIGAYLQQAGPMALQYPDMRGLLGAIMMFAVNTFRSARPVETAFDEFSKKLSQEPAAPPPGQEQKDNGAAEQAKMQVVQMQTQAKQQLEATASQERIQMAQIKSQADVEIARLRRETEQEKLALERDTKNRELLLREREVSVKERTLEIDREQEAERLALEAVSLAPQDAQAQRDGDREDDREDDRAATEAAEPPIVEND
jgi:hypothetical protein